jgi:hypothetical protein
MKTQKNEKIGNDDNVQTGWRWSMAKSSEKVGKKKKDAEPKEKKIKKSAPVKPSKTVGLDMGSDIADTAKSKVSTRKEKPVKKTSDGAEKKKVDTKVENKKSKKRKKRVDNVSQSVTIVDKGEQKPKRGRKSKNIIVEKPVDPVKVQPDDSDEYIEGKKGKRKRKARKTEPKQIIDYTFQDSFDVPDGDARLDFNKTDESCERYFWCLKSECRIFSKLCGKSVTPTCHKRLKCEHFEYGMEVKAKYRLKTVDRELKKSKKGAETEAGEIDQVHDDTL